MRMAFDAVADAGWFIEVGGGAVEETDCLVLCETLVLYQEVRLEKW